MRRIFMLGTTVVAAGVVLVLLASQSTAIAATGQTFTVYGFGHTKFIAAPGTNPKRVSKGDELIVTGVLTSTQRNDGHYPIVGRDAGLCVFTHAKKSGNGRAECMVTATLRNEGSITVQGNIGLRHGHLEPSTLAVTGGTEDFVGAGGTLLLQPARHHNVFTFSLT